MAKSDSSEEFQILRQELKDWEIAHAKLADLAHGGRKAGREDIKNHPEIGIFSTPDFPVDKQLTSLL